MSSTILKSVKRVLGYGLTAGLIIGGGSFVYSQYPMMSEQVEKIQTPYFESYSFIDRLASSSSFLVHNKFNEVSDEEAVYEVPYWEYTLERYPDELDYYVVNGDGSKEEGRQSDLLKQMVNQKSDEALWSELKARYQFVIEFRFDEEGNVLVEELYGADLVQVEPLVNQMFYYNSYTNENQFKEMTFVYGVPAELSEGGHIARELQYYDEENYIIVSIPYLIVTALVTILGIFLLPYKWIKNSGLVKGLLVVPLELRFLFVIGTVFAVMGAPLLLIATETGMLTDMVGWTINTGNNELIVSAINVCCWSAFIAVMAIHTLYIKEFFIIGPWKMLRRHTIIGQIFGLFRRHHEPEKIVEERIVYQESPAFLLMKDKLTSLSKRLTHLEKCLQDELSTNSNDVLGEEIKAVKEEIQLLLQLSEAQSVKTEVNLIKLMSDVMINLPESFNEFELKTKVPESSVTVLAHQKQLATVLEQLFIVISNDALRHSRVYLEVSQVSDVVEMTLRYVTSDEANLSDELYAWVKLMIENQDGTYEVVRDGDLVKFILRLQTR